MSFEEDLSEFLDAGDFAVSAIIGAASVEGIFDRQYVEVNGMESYRPTFLCAAADVAAIARGAAINVEGAAFELAEQQPDGTGMVLLILEAQ